MAAIAYRQAGHLSSSRTVLSYSNHISATDSAGCLDDNPISQLAPLGAHISYGHLRKGQVLGSRRLSSASFSNFAQRVLPYRKFGEDWCRHTLLSKTQSCGRTAQAMSAIQREKVGPGQESVWDYPRPPRLAPVTEKIKIIFNGETIAETTSAYRVLETSHPPVYYIPTVDVRMEHITRASGSSFCEWKGNATWWSVSVGAKTAEKVAWSYENPTSNFLPIKGFLAFYAGPMDACFVGEEKAQPQPGNFYGGWVTSNVVGPFKGGPGSWGW